MNYFRLTKINLKISIHGITMFVDVCNTLSNTKYEIKLAMIIKEIKMAT